MSRDYRAAALCLALWLGGPLFCQDSAVVTSKPQEARKEQRKKADGRLTLTPVSEVVLKSEMSRGMFVDPIKCDSDGNLYFMNGADATSGINKLSPKGERMATFAGRQVTDLPVQNTSYLWLQWSAKEGD